MHQRIPNVRAVVFMLALAAALLADPAAATARACEPARDSYNCLIVPEYRHGWRNVTALTYCYPSSNWTMTYGSGEKTYGTPLPAQYRQSVDAAANIWSDTPGLRVSLALTACTKKTDIRVYGFRGNAKPNKPAGEGGCFADSQRYCAKHSGFVFLSVDVPADDRHAQFLLHAGVHELGHVLGLGHPCGNACRGPVMSYATCKNLSECPAAPDYNDVVGVQLVHGWSDSSGGCQIAVPDVTAGVSPVEVHSSRPLERIEAVANAVLSDRPDISGVAPAAPLVLREVPSGGEVLTGALGLVARLADHRVDAYATLDAAGGAISRGLAWVADEAGVSGVPELSPGPVRCLTGS